ncbi:hypothetical protein F3I62_06440 [Pseudomonas sp. R-28-1W-6]|nr:hypothetical protein [Pseudomonas sp. R-28-1W-6]
MKSLAVMVLGSVLLLSGCSFSAPGVHARIGDVDSVHLDVGDGHHGGGSFCPPGHRMKGSC